MKQKVLITGASGFLGYHLINAAIENNLEVYAAIRSKSNIKHLEDFPIKYVVLNYSDEKELTKVFAEHGFDYVLHAAGTTKANSEKEYDLINNTYTHNLALAAAKNQQVKRFVFISSLAAIGPLKSTAEQINEHTQPNPVTAYGRSKLSAERSLATVKIPVTILRPTAIYGPREKDIFIITQYLNKRFEPYIGKAAQKLSFVYSKDMAALAVKALTADTVGAYNVTDGKEYNRYEYARIVKNILGKKSLQLHLPVSLVKGLLFMVEKISAAMNKVPAVNREKLSELMAENWICDISKARQELNYSPAYDLQKGLEESIEWYKTNSWLK